MAEMAAAGADERAIAQALFVTPGTVRGGWTRSRAARRPPPEDLRAALADPLISVSSRIQGAAKSPAQLGPSHRPAEEPPMPTDAALQPLQPMQPIDRARATQREAPVDPLCGGAVHLPGDPGYDAARTAWNVAVDQRPAAVAYPADAAEVAEVVRAAAAAGLRVAPQGTGHNAGPLAARASTTSSCPHVAR